MSGGRETFSNQPSFSRILSENVGLLILALLFCFFFSLFAADPVNRFLDRNKRNHHRETVYILMGLSAVLSIIYIMGRSSSKGPYHLIEFDGSGVVSERGEKRQRWSWIDVVDTHYDEAAQKGLGGFMSSDRQLFQVYLRDGSGVLCSDFDSRTLDTIVERFNSSTLHLPFHWSRKATPEHEERNTLSGTIIKIEDRGDALKRKPARVQFRIDSTLYGKPSDYPHTLEVLWEFWWFNAAQLPNQGDKASLCGYFSPTAQVFYAGGSGYCKRYDKRLRSDG